MAPWSLDDIAWGEFDPTQAQPELIALVKAASMVEYNGSDYARYLCEVFAGDAGFQEAAGHWAKEEVQHGHALRKWAELADPAFDFEKCFAVFTNGYALPAQVTSSVRGSRSGELIARCIVETVTSAYYTALKDYNTEPVLKALCAKIAADEFRHYKLFYTHLQRYLDKENLTALQRLKIALSRISESGDDELAYAFYAANANSPESAYRRKVYTNRYFAFAGMLYRKSHIDRMTVMTFKAVRLQPHTDFNRSISLLAWYLLKLRTLWARGLPRMCHASL